MSKLPAQPPLVGRRDELAQLVDAIDGAERGAGRVVFLSGEGGVGKTRLAGAAAEIAAKRGWTVAVGRAYPIETGVPYALFSDALLAIIRRIEPSSLSVLTRGGSAELAHLFPALGAAGGKSAAAGLDASEFKARLLWNFSQFLGRLAAKQPLLVLLDNLQWADASSLELLHFVARHLESQKVLLLCTYNEAERDANAALRTTEQSLHKLGLVDVHRLRPLDEGNVAELVRSLFGGAGETDPFAALLYNWTRGNPFFVEETLKAMIDSGRIYQRDGRWSGFELQTFEMPLTVRDAVAGRLSRLSPSARSLANVAAVMGARAGYDTLLAIAGGEEPAFVAAVEELSRERVLEEKRHGDVVAYDFSHPLLQQVLYSDLGHARATMMHGEIAEALERMYGASAGDHSDELALHFSRASRPGVKGIKYLTIAGEMALEKYANREAASYLNAALEATTTGPDSIRSEIPRARVVLALARARQRLGEYDRALELWAIALEDAASRGDAAAIAAIEYRTGLALYWSGRHADALAHYDAGVAAAKAPPDSQSALRLRLARGICLQELGRLDEAQADLESALDAAAKGGVDSQVLLARAHRALLLLYAWTGPLDVARKHGEDALRHAEASGQLMLQWSAHWAMAILTGVSGDEPAVARHLDESARLADQSRSPLLPLWTAELKVQYLSSTGDWDEGLALAERTIALAQRQGQRTLLPRLYVWAGMMYLPRGEAERAKKYFDDAWVLSGADKGAERPLDVPSVVPAHLGLAAYHLARGDYAQAVAIGESGLAIADRTGHAIWGLQWLLPLICEAALLNLDFVRAEALSKRMRRDATRLQHRLGLAFSDACDALLVLYRDNDPAKAISLLRSAADQFDAIPLPVQSARVRRRLAYALMDNGQPEEGMRELKSAHEVFVKLRATGELDATREALRELGVRPPSRSTIPGAAGLTGRETEIARMVAARKSNKEIGAELKISARTVSTHLSNIFLKLNVASRGELADFVRERGLAG
ncbi:MAG: AAA family ATPase [Gemmatimonadota bacterium]|nr:AAA family ATPase [Gemmatimonadota bacterium]